MHFRFLFLLAVFSQLFIGCQDSKCCNDQVITQRFIHKYGYDVSREEWENEKYPGQVITTLRNGVTMTATYDEGVLHGNTTYTYPYSHTIESQYMYERGNLVKKTTYDIRGVPRQEELFLSSNDVKVTTWFSNGTPRSVEGYENGKLTAGEYFTLANETESKVLQGNGEKTQRDEYGKLQSKDVYKDSMRVLSTTYYSNGTPHMVTSYQNGKMNGERKVFAQTGEPLQIERFHDNLLQGPATYFQNGTKYLEVTYVSGKRHGVERHFIDGETLVEETKWENDHRHGPSTVYSDGFARIQWFFNGHKVTKGKFVTLCQQERNIADMTSHAHKKGKY